MDIDSLSSTHISLFSRSGMAFRMVLIIFSADPEL